MLRCWKRNILPLCLCLLLCLTACGTQGGAPTAPAATATPAPWKPETIPAVAGEESSPPAPPEGEPDGMEGSYYNDFLRETLTLDGRGECSLSWPGGVMGGMYRPTDDGWTVTLADIRLHVTADDGGDLHIDGKQGRFLRDWDFWGITPTEAGIHPTNTLPDTEEIALGGGAYRYRDFPAGLALTYDEALQVLAGRLSGAVCVADGRGGYVIGRNVTQQLETPGRSAEEFLEDYIRSYVFMDFETLFGAVSAYDALRILPGEKAGRLAAGDIRLTGAGQTYAARVLLYTSVYADGTENYICKCVLAPAGETAQLDALAAGVRDVGAARIVQLD